MLAYAAAVMMSNPVRMQMDEAMGRALTQFNAGAYKEAVDEFEVPYHLAPRREQPLYLGLIRVAAGLHHFTRGQPVSALKLYQSGREILARLAPSDSDLDLEAMLAELDEVYLPLVGAAKAEAASLRPGRRPRMLRRDHV